MPGFDAPAEFVKRQIVILCDALADELARFVIQPRLVAAGVRQGVRRAGLALAAEEVLDRSEADLEEFSDFAL